MKNDIILVEVHQLKRQMDQQILASIQSFQEQTGLQVQSVDLHVVHTMGPSSSVFSFSVGTVVQLKKFS